MRDAIFYVYEHWRTDTDMCFYVGKGKRDRAFNMRRGGHHQAICEKMVRTGFSVEVRMVQTGLDEADAFSLEIERIAFWRSMGVALINRTNGGDGVSGLQWSEERRRKQSTITKRQFDSAEFRAKHYAALTQADVIEKIRASALLLHGDPEFKAKHSTAVKAAKRTPEARERQAAASRKQWENPETREKAGEVQRRVKRTPQAREKASIAATKRFQAEESRAALSETIIAARDQKDDERIAAGMTPSKAGTVRRLSRANPTATLNELLVICATAGIKPGQAKRTLMRTFPSRFNDGVPA